MAMNSIALGVGAQQQLDNIFTMAYGSGRNEGVAGGKGNIGLLNGRVIKFNTHWTERFGSASEAEIKASNELRGKLVDLSQEILKNLDPEEQTKVLASIYEKLDLYEKDGEMCITAEASKKLLDRSIVASVYREVCQASGVLQQEGSLFKTMSEGPDLAKEVRREMLKSASKADFATVSDASRQAVITDSVASDESTLGRLVAEGASFDKLPKASGMDAEKAVGKLDVKVFFAAEIATGEESVKHAPQIGGPINVQQAVRNLVKSYLRMHPAFTAQVMATNEKDAEMLAVFRSFIHRTLADEIAKDLKNKVGEKMALQKGFARIEDVNRERGLALSDRNRDTIIGNLASKISNDDGIKRQVNGRLWQAPGALASAVGANETVTRFVANYTGLLEAVGRQSDTSLEVRSRQYAYVQANPGMKVETFEKDLAAARAFAAPVPVPADELAKATTPEKKIECVRNALKDLLLSAFAQVARRESGFDDMLTSWDVILPRSMTEHRREWTDFLAPVGAQPLLAALQEDVMSQSTVGLSAEEASRYHLVASAIGPLGATLADQQID